MGSLSSACLACLPSVDEDRADMPGWGIVPARGIKSNYFGLSVMKYNIEY
jgi:hypothetical protein